MFNWFELAFSGALIFMAVLTTRTDEARPYRMDVCLVGSGPNGEDLTTEVWSDFADRELAKYPGSYKGRCRKTPKGE